MTLAYHGVQTRWGDSHGGNCSKQSPTEVEKHEK
jgi:hypothetical protein